LITETRKIKNKIKECFSLLGQGKIDLAEKELLSHLSSNSENKESLFFQGHLELAKGNLEKAIECFEKVLQEDPLHTRSLKNIGICYFQLEKFELSIKHFEKSLSVKSDDFEAYYQIATTYAKQKKWDKAKDFFLKSLSLKPDDKGSFKGLLVIHNYTRNTLEAKLFLDKAKSFLSELEILNEKAHYLMNLNREDDAILLYEKSLEKPKLKVPCLTLIIDRLIERDLLDKAEAFLEKIELNCVVSIHLLAKVVGRNGKTNKSLELLEKALKLEEDYLPVEAYYIRQKLRTGDSSFWKHYNTYRDISASNFPFKKYSEMFVETIPDDLEEIFVFSAEGIGDCIIFCRYLNLLSLKIKHIHCLVSDTLIELFRFNFDSNKFTFYVQKDLTPEKTSNKKAVAFGALPSIFDIDVNNIPFSKCYLNTEPLKVESFRGIFPSKKLKVGLVWQGNKHFGYDSQRSIALEDFYSLLKITEIEFYSLQKDSINDKELKNLPEDLKLHSLSQYLHNFSHTAAIIQHLDIVISVCTATAHLAAAMGKETWILVNNPVSGVYWGMEKENSPWYDSVTLFRRKTGEDSWKGAISKVEEKLLHRVCSHERK
jgi:tetratricopeptide (TPR) repeat protein